MFLAENVRQLRTDRGWSQGRLAEEIGVSYPRISEIENGNANPKLHTISRIAEAFGVSVADLLSDRPKKNQK